jgi:hypothetical protein
MDEKMLKMLAEGIDRPDRQKEAKRLVEKWDRTGLLEGLTDRPNNKMRSTMARLLENQTSWLITEASTVGNIVGFQNVAFPIVRRVFAGLIANELVSVQPMSLPSGLLFYLDYQFGTVKAGDKSNSFATGGSLFGDSTGPGPSSPQSVGPGLSDLATNGFYNLGTSYSQRERVSNQIYSASVIQATLADVSYDPELSASVAAGMIMKMFVTGALGAAPGLPSAAAVTDAGTLKQWVPLSGSSTGFFPSLTGTIGSDGTPVQLGTAIVYRRHTQAATSGVATPGGLDLMFILSGTSLTLNSDPQNGNVKLSFVVGSTLNGGTSGTLTLPEWESDLGITPNPTIPEINLNIQSVGVTANTRKLRARWTPELAQDLSAYQNLDAEVELTQVISEAIALEIDREILADLLFNATGANYYWSRKPGNFVDKTTGNSVAGATFTGTVREWYETLIETVIDVSNTIHRKTLRGAANFMVTSPDVSTILEASVLYKPLLSLDPKETMFTVGTEKIGTLNNRFTVYKDPYFPRNKILVGYKGGSFLECGYVYAPYIPLIVTPTIYAPEDFTPRKGVMTRYAKHLVRSDFYGSIVCLDMNVI